MSVKNGKNYKKMLVEKWKKPKNGKLLDKSLLMAHAGFEPATFALLARRSNQLS